MNLIHATPLGAAIAAVNMASSKSAKSAKSAQLRSRGRELLMQYKVDRSVRLRNKLVRLNAGLVRKIAHRVSHQCAEP